MGRGGGAKDGRAWLFLLFPTRHIPRGPQSSAQVPLWACLSPEPSFLFLMKNQVELELIVVWSILLLKFGEPYSQASAQDIPK